jgi:hypothetical protein
MSMTAQAEYDARTQEEESHAELLLLLLLLQSREVYGQILRGASVALDNAPIRAALVDAGYAGANIIAANAVTPAEVVDLLKGSGYIEAAADLAVSQMAQTTASRINHALDEIGAAADAEKAKAVKAELDAIAEMRAGNAAGNMVVDGAEGLKDALVNNGTKTWVNMGDRRVRRTHMSAGGQTVPANGFFSVGGGMLRFPRDPAGPARETMRCRCVARYSQEW